MLAAFLVYNLGRMLATQELGRADAHANGVLDVERWLRLPAEATLQTWALGHDWIVDAGRPLLRLGPLPPHRRGAGLALPLPTPGVPLDEAGAHRLHLRRLGVDWRFRSRRRGCYSLGMVDTGHAGGISIYQAPVMGGIATSTPRCRACTSAGRC